VHEAAILADVLDRIAPTSILDIGSGTRIDREIIQPHIAAAFNGHKVVWTNISESTGAMCCDVTERSTLTKLPWCEMVTAFSVLEHVVDIDAAIDNLAFLTKKWLVVSVPCSYPEHHCPIDNLWRPSPDELADRISGSGLEIVDRHQSPPENFRGVDNASASLVVATVGI
jgi:hypothetical protein